MKNMSVQMNRSLMLCSALMAKLTILVVEDDPLARKIMETHLGGHSVEFAADKASALEKLAARNHDLCFIDLKLGRNDECSGLQLIPVAASKGVYSVVMSGHDSENYIERAYELGCNDFFSKGNEEENIGSILERFLRKRGQVKVDEVFVESFVTEDPSTRATIAEALNYAPSSLPVLLLGPSGTGKTTLAKVIHDHSNRSGEFVAINCAAYSEDLLEAELFGYRKGAFTGASDNRRGRLLQANGGTLFLDEVGSMSLKMQTKLLKAIEEGTFYPLGADKLETSHFRIISATLEDIRSLINSNRMRFDFFQRIHGFTVQLKPLAHRKCDLLPLISFLTRAQKRLAFTPDAKAEILRHDWPGNIRELRKFVDLLLAGDEGCVSVETVSRLLKTIRVEDGTDSFATEAQFRFALSQGLNEAVDRFIDTIIKRAVTQNYGRKAKTLADLKISTRLLYSSLRRIGRHPRQEPVS